MFRMRLPPIWDVELCLLGIYLFRRCFYSHVPSKAISAAFSILLRGPHSRFLCVYPSDVQLYQMIKDISASYGHLDLLEGRVHRTLPVASMSM
jgi:hypothetical protein